MENKIYKFNVGQLWENFPWEIRINETIDGLMVSSPCEHARNIREGERQDSNGNVYWRGQFWECDVIVAYNEGQYDSTGLCLWCVLDAVDKIGLER